MKQSIKKACFLLLLAIASLSVAAGIVDLPVKTINGKRYHYYEVQPQETVYALCRRFDISRDELLAANPSVADGLKAGQTLLFPAEKDRNENQNTSMYMVQSGDTGYGISRRFNMTVDEFYQLNPDAVNGIKAGQYVKVRAENVSVAAIEKPVASHSADGEYEICPGETLYQIATAHGITLSRLLEANPSINPDNYKAGTRIVIPSSSAVSPVENPGRYIVKPGDTFYGIAHAHGISTEQLRAANPDVEMLRPDMSIVLPQACSETAVQPVAGTHVQDVSPVQPEVQPTVSPRFSSDTIVIAVALPLNASAKVRDARSANSVEFYRGFILAIDSMRNEGKPLKVLTYDTEGSNDRINQILSDPALKTANVIVAPDMAPQLDAFAGFAKANGIPLLNLFVIKDELYKTNPYIMHSNIPHDIMYKKAIDYFLTKFPDVTPVFLKRTGGKTDKAEFVELLKKSLSTVGRKYHEIEYSEKLSDATLTKLPAGINYAFIPVSSSVGELNRFLSSVNSYKEGRTDGGTVSLWGYAEWLTARGETLEKLHDANSYIFSRFYSVENDYDQDNLQNAFRRWYGIPIVDKIPRQGTYGFDTAMFLVRALNQNGGDFSRATPAYDGIQNAFEFIRQPGGGWINDEMFMINFGPSNTTFKFGI